MHCGDLIGKQIQSRENRCLPLADSFSCTLETNKEAKHGPEEWIKKMWYIYMMEYYLAIKRNEIGSFVETWMDLETVIHSEVRKRKKYNALMHTCGI